MKVKAIIIVLFIDILAFADIVFPKAQLVKNLSPDIKLYRIAQQKPFTLVAHYLEIQWPLRGHRLSVITAPRDDKSDAFILTPPMAIVNQSANNVIAAINTNAFAAIAGRSVHGMWLPGMPVNIKGWVCQLGKTIIAANSTRKSFWVDKERRLHLGHPKKGEIALEAVAGFGWLVKDGKTQRPIAASERRRPRSAIGISKSGKKMWWFVADGDRKDHSEGLKTGELALWLKNLSAHHAINLDGGGSSCLLVRSSKQHLEMISRPSGGRKLGLSIPRPLPLLLTIFEFSKSE